MNKLILSCFGLLAFVISNAYGISCIVCTTSSSSSCSDPYSGGTSLSQSASYIGCYKYIYTSSYGSYSSGYVGRGGYPSGFTCTPGSNGAGATYYCCSDKDNCNGAVSHTVSIILILSLLCSYFFASSF